MRRAMSSGVTNRRLSQFVPFKGDSFAQSPPDRVVRDKYPLRPGRVGGAETFQLIDEGVHKHLDL